MVFWFSWFFHVPLPQSLHITVVKGCAWYIDILEIIWSPACGSLLLEKVSFFLWQLAARLRSPVLTQSILELAWFIVAFHSCVSCSARNLLVPDTASPGPKPQFRVSQFLSASSVVPPGYQNFCLASQYFNCFSGIHLCH